MNKKYIKYIIEVAFFAAMVAIDLISKSIVFDLLSSGNSYTVWEGIFTVRLARNIGASFSMLSGKTLFLTMMPIIAIIGITILLVLRPNTPKNLRIGCIMIAAGALGNVVDRIVLGYVRDFIDYVFLETWFGIDFAIGNIADLFLLGGVIMLILYIIFEFSESDFYSKAKIEKLRAEKAKAEVSSENVEKVDSTDGE